MAIKFTIRKDKVILEPPHYLIGEFTSLKEEFGDKKANQILLFVFFMADLSEENFLKDVDFRHKEPQAKHRAFGDAEYKFTKEEWEAYEKAFDVYVLYNGTSDERAIPVYDRKIDELNTLMEETKPEIIKFTNPNTGEVKFSTNQDIITKIGLDIEKLTATKKKLKDIVMKQVTTGRTKANASSSLIEKGLLNGED